MQINASSAVYAGLAAIQSGQNRVDQAAQQIASATSQSTDYQAERLRGVDRSQQMDSATSVVELAQGKQEVELGVKVAKASDEMLGRFIDTYALLPICVLHPVTGQAYTCIIVMGGMQVRACPVMLS